jgi:hypothetical protein
LSDSGGKYRMSRRGKVDSGPIFEEIERLTRKASIQNRDHLVSINAVGLNASIPQPPFVDEKRGQ